MIRRPLISIAAVLAMAGLALADVPPAMDRVPADAPVVASIRSLSKFHSNIEAVAKAMKLPGDAMQGIAMAAQMLEMPGIDSKGSVAIAMVGGFEDDEPPVVVVLPVKDYAQFVKGLGGTGEGLEALQFQGKPLFVKSVGGGFAAAGPVKEAVGKFKGAAGNKAAHEKTLGAAGNAVADANDAFIMASLPALAPHMKQKLDEIKEMMQGMPGMGAQQMAGLAMMSTFADAFMTDGQAGIIGFSAGESGVKFDVAAQFKEGSEAAGLFTGKGKSGKLMASVPNIPYFIAGAFDVSSPGMKKLMKRAVEFSKAANPEGAASFGPMETMVKTIDKVDGQGFVVGVSSLMGGMLLNSATYIKTSDAAAYVGAVKQMLTEMNGKTGPGGTFQTSFQADQKAGERPVNTWSVRMKFDQDPATAPIKQAQQMMFGMGGGPSGYMVAAEGGVVTTMSANTQLLESAISAAKNGDGLGSQPEVKKVGAELPQDRVFEMYIGVKDIINTVLPMAMMFAGGGGEYQPPADLPPIGIAGVTQSGGARIGFFMPTAVLTAFKDIGEAFGGGHEAPDEPMEGGGEAQPKF